VAEHGRGNDHFGVVTAFENFEVGAASQGGFDLDADLARVQGPGRDLFDAHVFFAVEYGCFHG
jgi:hypothetical protein